jgi:multidrug efflux pump
LALGAGSKSRVSMGIVIIGGLMFALILTLYVIPAFYTYFSASGLKKKKNNQTAIENLNTEAITVPEK